jgi:signal transduction histidine kinase
MVWSFMVDKVRRDNSNVRFSRQLAMILMGVVAGLVLVIAAATFWISREHNKLAEAGTKRMITGGVSALADKLETIALDYSAWAAAHDAIIARDAPWIWENIGTGAASDAAAVDLIIIIEPGEAVQYGWAGGMGNEPSSDLLPADTIMTMLRLLDDIPAGSMQAASRFAQVNGETWLLAVTRVLPYEDSLPTGLIDAELPRQLFGTKVDDALMAELGGQFLVDDLRIAQEPAPEQSSLALGDGAGFGGYAVWTPNRPGDQILGHIAIPLILALGLIALASALVSRHAVRSAKRLESAVDAAQAADRSKTEFLANVSHELRTPMNGILGMGQLMQNMELEPKLAKLVDVLMASAQSQMTLIEDLLKIGRIDSGQHELDLSPFNPATALNEVHDMMMLKADDKGIALKLEIPGGFQTHVLGDKGGYKQILTNLIDNAIKFTDQGHVTVRMHATTHLDQMRIRLDIADTGAGIDPKDHQLVFERFGQVDGTLTRGTGGAGLGLSITRSLVELMGGTLELRSELGKGATFSADLRFEIVSSPEASIAA